MKYDMNAANPLTNTQTYMRHTHTTQTFITDAIQIQTHYTHMRILNICIQHRHTHTHTHTHTLYTRHGAKYFRKYSELLLIQTNWDLGVFW